jgi:hypothetical protein
MSRNTIIGKSYVSIIDQKVATAVAITPGMLLERTSGDLVQAHSTAAGPVEILFALEDAMQGNGIGDAYAVSVPVQIWKPIRGERVYATFDATSGGSAAIGDFLESAGDGSLRAYTAQASGGAVEAAGAIVGVCVEAVAAGGRFLVDIV